MRATVAGGEPSGVIAAVAAARSGADTLLIERYSFLGGNGTAGLMTCYNGFRNQRAPEALQTVKEIPAEYIAELVRLGGVAEKDNYARNFSHPFCEASPDFCNWEHDYLLYHGLEALAPYTRTTVHAKYWSRWKDVDVRRCVRIMTNAKFQGIFALEHEEGPWDGVEGARYLLKEVLAAL